MTAHVAAYEALVRLRADDVRRAVMCELGKRSLSAFVRQMWSIHHPATQLVWGWHFDAMAEHLEAVHRNQIQRLVINVPPGYCKSLMVSVYFPAWVWTHTPTWQFLCTAAAGDVVLRDARRHREVCASSEYQAIYCPQWNFDKGQDAKSNFLNSAGGYRVSRTTGQAMTGLRGDCRIIDDPIDASDAYSDKTKLQDINHWRDTVFATRNNSPDTREILIMQRLHENDLTGHLLTKDAGDWTHLCLPAAFEGARRCVTGIGWGDPRTAEGEPVAPAFQTAEHLQKIKADIGEAGWAAQYQQQPSPEAGVIFKREWFRYWTPDALPAMDAMIASCDFNRLERPKHTKDTDYAVLDVWGTHGRDRYLLRQVRQKMGLAASIQAVRDLYAHYPDLFRTLVEKSANGPSVIAAVQAEVEGVEGVSVQGESKIQRAGAVQPVVEAGRIFIPDPNVYPWVEYWLDEVCGFPGRRRDDRVDAFTMAIIWIEKHLSGEIYSFSLEPKAAAHA